MYFYSTFLISAIHCLIFSPGGSWSWPSWLSFVFLASRPRIQHLCWKYQGWDQTSKEEQKKLNATLNILFFCKKVFDFKQHGINDGVSHKRIFDAKELIWESWQISAFEHYEKKFRADSVYKFLTPSLKIIQFLYLFWLQFFAQDWHRYRLTMNESEVEEHRIESGEEFLLITAKVIFFCSCESESGRRNQRIEIGEKFLFM